MYQPRRRMLIKEFDQTLTARSMAELPEGIQNRQIRLACAVVLDALALADEDRSRRQFGVRGRKI